MPLLTDISLLKNALGPGQRLLGVDLGEKTIGLALSDRGRMIATPMQTLARGKFSVDVLKLLDLFAKHEVGGAVIGYPINMDGSEGPRCQSVRQYARNLLKHLTLPLLLWDERLSTSAVTRLLIEADASRARRAQLVDKLAAAYILQGALDRMTDISDAG
ncbi:MAG TPA: Holliday junction resolvase RuvX [Alphaproteobacteria bacterium]|jgi:putative holliday junction resolvase|nr:Holliday junction resolvase RuvX [Alphaproteobacteria bacterium]